jgi:hypothetical protein
VKLENRFEMPLQACLQQICITWCRAANFSLTFTPWCRILFEKLTATQLVKKYPASLGNPKVHHRVHKSPPLDPILSQSNPVRSIDPYLPKVHLNVILPPTPRSSHWSLAFGPPNQNPVSTSPLPMRATCPAHLILLDIFVLWTKCSSNSGRV